MRVSKRTYDDGCGIAHAMNLIGDRWAILIARDLLLGPKRFTDLQAGLRGVGANVLARRLRDLEQTGVVRRRTLPPPAGSRVYELTEWAAGLQSILAGLARWGAASPLVRPTGEVGADSLMLGLRSFFDPAKMPDGTATYDIAVGNDRFTVHLADRRLDISRGQPHRADVTVQTDPKTLAALLGKTQRVSDAITHGRLHIVGNTALLEELLDATTLPVPNALERAPADHQ